MYKEKHVKEYIDKYAVLDRVRWMGVWSIERMGVFLCERTGRWGAQPFYFILAKRKKSQPLFYFASQRRSDEIV